MQYVCWRPALHCVQRAPQQTRLISLESKVYMQPQSILSEASLKRISLNFKCSEPRVFRAHANQKRETNL